MALKKILLPLGIAILLAAAIGYAYRVELTRRFFNPTDSSIPSGMSGGKQENVEVVAGDLSIPWGLSVLPEGDILVTERTGTLQRVGKDNKKFSIEGVQHVGEGGLLGLALDPDFNVNKRVYLYMTTLDGESLTNRIERYTLDENSLRDRQIIFSGIPGERYHDGGRLAFGPDRNLYVTTGDAGNPESAQDTSSLAGKILRITTDGKPAPDNPFDNAVYSYGHRNPQGLAWDDDGNLWSTEHGRSGARSGFDELNLIKPGNNYGWPLIEGDEVREGMIKPVAHSGADETWAPAGLAHADGSLYFAGLRGQTLYEAKLRDENRVEIKGHFRESFRRLRTTEISGGNLYLTTSNTDGRGGPKEGDDKILRIKLGIFR